MQRGYGSKMKLTLRQQRLWHPPRESLPRDKYTWKRQYTSYMRRSARITVRAFIPIKWEER